MNDNCVSSPLEQQILRAIQDLEGTADLENISARVNQSTPQQIPSQAIQKNLERLQDRLYISSALAEAAGAKSDTPRTVYRVETFGERALKLPPVYKAAGSVAAMKANVFILYLLFLVETINRWTVKNAFIGRFLPYVVLAGTVWVFFSALRVRRMVYRGE